MSLTHIQLSGFADEASPELSKQIQATKELGWRHISARGINGKNIHDLSESEFQSAVELLEQHQIQIAEIGSMIGSWAKTIHSDFKLTLEEIDRCIPRMQQLNVPIVRVMSYAQQPWGEEQFEQERFRRLREVFARFADAGLTVAHENCMNWGGFSSEHTLRLLEEVPGMKLIFDTGNPTFQKDRARPNADGSFPWQDSLEVFEALREHIIHIHVKDCTHPKAEGEEPNYTMPGEGLSRVPEIMARLLETNYQGIVAIEPHVATVFHAKAEDVDWQQCYDSYIQYGKHLERILQQENS